MKEYIVNSEEECLFYKHDEHIRCKDCKWQGNESDCPMFDPKMMRVNDFCSWAERKEE